jgi:hypothetical protein
VSLLGYFDDAMNPIMVKELRQAVQSRFVSVTLSLLIMLQVLVLGIYLITADMLQEGPTLNFHAGRTVFYLLQGFLLATCILFVPLYAGIRLAAERSDANVDLLFISTLKPGKIIAGKFCSALMLALTIFSACAPFMAFTYLLRGIDIPSIVFVLLMDFLLVAGCTQWALFLAAVPANWAFKALLGLILLGTLGQAIGYSIGGSIYLLETGAATDTLAFWGRAGAVAGVGLLGIGLLHFFTVAMITPASANRALPVRLYMLAMWLLSGAILWGWSYLADTFLPLIAWMGVGMGLGSLQALIAICERDEWHARVTRRIPKNALARAVAFVLYSGSAGGLLFAVFLAGAAFLLGSVAWERFDTWEGALAMETMMEGGPIFCIYMLAYALTAGVLTRFVLRAYLRPLYSWLLAMVLLALGTSLPALFGFLFFSRIQRREDIYSMLILNPLSGLTDSFNRNVYMGFSLAWLGAALLLAAGWLLPQFKRFKPLPPEVEAA